MTFVLFFTAGLVLEGLCVLWLNAYEKDVIGKATLLSMLFCSVQLFGVGSSGSELRKAVPYVLGYGTGTALAMLVRRRARAAALARAHPSEPPSCP